MTTTRPIFSSSLADLADDVESGAVLQLEVGDDHVGPVSRRTTARASATVPTEPTTSCRPRGRTRRRGPRGSARGRRRSGRGAVVVGGHARASGRRPDSCGQTVGFCGRLLRRHAGDASRRTDTTVPCGTLSVTLRSPPTRAARSRMISSPCESSRPRAEPAAVVGDDDLGRRRSDRALDVDRRCAPECRTALVMASWAIRSSSLSTSGRSRVVCSSRVTWIGMPLLALRWRASEPIAVPRESFSPMLGAQGLDRAAYLADDHREPLAQHRRAGGPGRSPRAPGRRGCRRSSRARPSPARRRRASRGRAGAAPRRSRSRGTPGTARRCRGAPSPG